MCFNNTDDTNLRELGLQSEIHYGSFPLVVSTMSFFISCSEKLYAKLSGLLAISDLLGFAIHASTHTHVDAGEVPLSPLDAALWRLTER